jgi:putative holliday junction resolvase
MKRDMPEAPERSARVKTERSARVKISRTILAFDFGLKRIGVAVGEPELRSAHPLPAISDFAQVEKLVAEWQPAHLVVGRPTSANGEPHKMTRQAEDFARRLERRFKLPVARVDERYTSVEAESRLRGLKKKAVDSVAAQLILEQYFDQAA